MFKLLACEVMRDETESLLRDMGALDAYDCEWVEMGLHSNPKRLRESLEERIARCAGKAYEAIILMFGLCSNATAGLAPPADSRLIIPRVHDCISVFLGSARRYLDEHEKEAGTYWFSKTFIENVQDGDLLATGGIGSGLGIGDEDGERLSAKEMRAKFVEEYGEENADYLMETLVESWRGNYSRAVYLRWDGNPGAARDAEQVAACADENGWRYEEIPVDLRLLRALLTGPWPEEEFAVALPGQRLAATNDHRALAAE